MARINDFMMFSNDIARNPNGHRKWMKVMYLICSLLVFSLLMW